MLLQRAALERIRNGEVDVVFRRWRRPSVRPGTRLRTAVGELLVDEVREVSPSEVKEADARRAGFVDRATLFAELDRHRPGTLYRVTVRYAGADRRRALAADADLDDDDIRAVLARLDRFDRASRRGPWTRATLDAIAEHPATRAGDLAAALGHDRDWFKTNVRKLKEFGLTESLGVGYRLSPRGQALRGHTTGPHDTRVTRS